MRRIIFYSLCFLLLLGGLIYLNQPKNDTQSVLDQKSHISPTASPSPSPKVTKPDLKSMNKESIYVRDSLLTLGESKHSMIEKLGIPGRIAETEYDFDYYIYNNDYQKLLFVAIKNSKIIGFYTDSIDFVYMGITPSSDVKDIGKALGRQLKLSQVLDYSEEEFSLKLLMDTLDTQKVTGVYLLSNQIKMEGYTDDIFHSIELMAFDLANSVRVRNDQPVLTWSSTAAKAARNHSKDMAEENYFDHISLMGDSPGDRLIGEGIAYTSVGENIIGGNDSAILSNHVWFNSLDHRSNMLNPTYRYQGNGFHYQKSSTYKSYLTQTYYR